jgi:hypothetical protein
MSIRCGDPAMLKAIVAGAPRNQHIVSYAASVIAGWPGAAA